MKSKILALLGFAAKAGKLSYGAEAARSALYGKRANLILAGCDVSPKTLKEITFHSNKCDVELRMLDDIDIITLSNAVGRKCGVLAVNDSSFAEAIIKLTD